MSRLSKLMLYVSLVVSLGFLMSCGGPKSLVQTIPAEGVELSIAPAVGETLAYKRKSDFFTEVSHAGGTQSNSTMNEQEYRMSFLDADESGAFEVKFFFDSEESGAFQNGQYVPAKEKSELVGKALTLSIDSAGKLGDWEISKSLGYAENGQSKDEIVAAEYHNRVEFYKLLPTHPVNIGSTWTETITQDTAIEGGGTTVEDKQTFTIVDFANYKGHKCAKITVDISKVGKSNFEVTQEGTTYKVFAEQKSKGEGQIYFDFENGYIVEVEFKAATNANRNIENIDTDESQQMSMYNEQATSTELIE